MLITLELVTAYSLCPRKAYLLMRGDATAPPHEYMDVLHRDSAKTKAQFLASCQARAVSQGGILFDARFLTGELEATVDVMIRRQSLTPKPWQYYEPHLFVGKNVATNEHKIAVAFLCKTIEDASGVRPPTGVIVTKNSKLMHLNVANVDTILLPILASLRAWASDLPPDPPPIVLNDHCPLCPFKAKCRRQAEQEDSLSLLDRMTPKVMRRYHGKGIFTVNQLSYLFKPRRRRRRGKAAPKGFTLELQALALRTGKVYVHEPPAVAESPVELFLDIEGIPDDDFQYLIGVVVFSQGREERHSFWADSPEEESAIFARLLHLVAQYERAPIYHYGSYEPRALDRVAKKHGLPCDAMRERLMNVNSLIFGKVYFPTRSNTLKDLGRIVGASWTSTDASGLQSLVWRHRWDETRDNETKQLLLTYNLDDCNALRLLVYELRNIGETTATRQDVDFADRPKQIATDKGQQIHDSLEWILKSAHAEYKDNRIAIRRQGGNETDRKGPGGRKGRPFYKRIIPTNAGRRISVRRKTQCPRSENHVLEPSGELAEHIIIDLVFTRTGCRKVITKYTGQYSFCSRCKERYAPPQIQKLKGCLFGHSFRCWAVYQRIVLRLPYLVIRQVFYDLFREQINEVSVINFLTDLATYYVRTERQLLKSILSSPFIHIDETKINIRGTDHYVWVLTDGRHVVFRLTETREALLIQELLNGYSGILIADFYAGYDACACRQQRCLVHLIRDLNDELWKNPFNTELEEFVAAFKDLISPIMDDVAKYGLKRRHLSKHEGAVDRFYNCTILGREFTCEVARTFQKRFLRYRDSLFTFLKEDGIPWNNNMAERAIRHLAVQRKISGSFFKRVAEHYLRLLGIAQTCRFQDKSFLGFLLSGGLDVNAYKEKKRPKVSKPVWKAKENVVVH
ncbi:MAG: TM0106 family RecB-like putative nuclease [Deltaproteobacteria bacterium]|nr:TM0106 family RecB-like putative nuclease [Deltaproteobacteria bacterium]